MTRWMKHAAVALLVTLPVAALAFGPGAGHEPNPEEMALHLAEKLDLDEAGAEVVVEILLASRDEGEALKGRAMAEKEALTASLAASDEKGMTLAMKEIERIHKEAQSLKADTGADIQSVLTVEQQALMTLMHMERQQRKGEMMERTHEMRERRAQPFGGDR